MKHMNNNNLKDYNAPRIQVVSFKVENAFGSITEESSSNGMLRFGFDADHGLMNHGTGDHSGLGQYNEGGNIFGETI
ncbi:MAG: hypothetical protein IJK84_07390 [Bacteroidales bacterium]|nr:hypothetical protein [Bacteroidales bacterium]